MSKFRIAWLPGDGVGGEVLQAARIVLDRLGLEAEYLPGDIGWEFWCGEGDPLPPRTIELLQKVDAAMFGAITSKPVRESEEELAPNSAARGYPIDLPSYECGSSSIFTSACDPAELFPGIHSTPGRVSISSSSARIRKISIPAWSSIRCRKT